MGSLCWNPRCLIPPYPPFHADKCSACKGGMASGCLKG